MEGPRISFRNSLILIILSAILGTFVLGAWQFFQFHDGKLHLVFCDVGQGDAIYLKTPNSQEVLIDGGPDDKVLDCLSSRRPFYDRKIEVLVLTHPQADHLTGLVSVLQRYRVDYLVTENISNPTAVFSQFRQVILDKKVKIYNPKNGSKLRLGETELNFYWPKTVTGDKSLWSKNSDINPTTVENPNEYSLVLAIRSGNFISLQTGDAESEILEKISNLPVSLTVLQVPHHGSKKALSQKVLEVLKPKLGVISVGEGNSYGHPTPETLKLLEALGIRTLRTDKDGEIEIIFDGQRWSVQ